MGIRLLSAFIGSILVVVIMNIPTFYFNIALAIIACIGLSEIFRAFKNYKLSPVVWMGYFSVLGIFFINELRGQNALLFLFIIVFSLFFYTVLSKNKTDFISASVTLFAIFYIPFLILFVSLTRGMENGILFVWLILIGGWVTDTFAYFAGKLFGKHKLIPELSPKKTIEGAIGGVIGCTLVVAIYGFYINRYTAVNIEMVHYIVLGVLMSLVAQIGDISASAIKRKTGIKDFGNIMPGHGGIIDRFDSILFVAPIVYFYMNFIII